MNSTSLFRNTLKQLLTPVKYFFIASEHNHKKYFDWYAPFFMAAAGFFINYSFDAFVFYGSEGFLQKTTNFLQNLPGFYIAALAAIATFGKSNIDKIMDSPELFVTDIREGSPTQIRLTRRRFLSLLFSLLTFLSILLVMCSNLVLSVNLEGPGLWSSMAQDIFVFVYFLFLSQLLCLTMLGLFYLGERLHKVD